MNEKATKKDPWTDPDPQPGDFDDYLDEMEWVEVIFDPDLEIRVISEEEKIRRMGPIRLKRFGLENSPYATGSPEPATKRLVREQ
jgi:hypothetical protein